MYKYELTIKEANSDTYEPLRCWARPFTDGTTLDETLDEGQINLSLTMRSRPIPPFSKIRIKIFEERGNGTEEQVGEINRVVGSTKCVKRKYAGRELYDWSIQTLEETKLLERYICDSMMSTDYLIKDYSGGFNPVKGVVKATGGDQPTAKDNVIFTPYQQGTSVEFPAVREVAILPSGGNQGGTQWSFRWDNGSLKIISPSDDEVYSGDWEEAHTATLSEDGTYQIKYVGQYIYEYYTSGAILPVITHSPVTITFNVGIFASIIPRTQPTITSVCERLLSAGITRRKDIDTQKFTLDPAFATKYANIPAPEFSFTRQTLFEALLTVGGYIHAIPRLNGNVVTFDELGGDDEIDMTNFPKMVYEDRSQDINDYSSTIDSPAQNLINTQDRVKGSITEFGNDYITVRAEVGEVLIDADTAIIRTGLPINQIIKVECGFIDGRTEPVGDITPYVYEAAEYDTLSSMWDSAYPYSKGFALRYAQGDNKITALQTKLEYPTSVQADLANPAIINIIQAVTGKKIPPTEIHKLAFRVTYVPIVTSRVTQRKPYGNTGGASNGAGWDNALVYNQGGNTMESTFYGDKMKGAIARLGNQVVQRTYDFIHYNQIPKCGQKLDGMYVARVDCEYDLVRIRATVTLTKDFNMLSQYVGLNSNYRLYDVSEKQSVERFVNYSENIYVGDPIEYKETDKPSILQYIYNMLSCTLYHSTCRAQVAKITGADKDGNDIGKPVLLPVISFGFGNSLVFAFSMYDNYGAGFQNSNEYLSDKDNKYKGVQRLVPYSDGLGELETLSFSALIAGWTPTADDQAAGGAANLYPQDTGIITANRNNTILKTGEHPLIIQKDSREALSVVYQAHFVANRPSIVLGPSLTYSNAYVNNVSEIETLYRLYMFNRELNMLDGVIDLSDAQLIVGGGNAGADRAFRLEIINEGTTNDAKISNIINSANSGITYKSWGIVEVDNEDSTQGKLFIGENVELAPNETAPAVFFRCMANE